MNCAEVTQRKAADKRKTQDLIFVKICPEHLRPAAVLWHEVYCGSRCCLPRDGELTFMQQGKQEVTKTI